MARNQIVVDGSPDDVFAVLLDPSCYPEWVVGAKEVRAVDDGWPAPGSAFHHSVGIGPLHIEDHTEIVAVDRPSTLVLKARALPAGVARVAITVEGDEDGGSIVRIEESATGGPAAHVPGWLLDPVVWARNEVGLRRLGSLVRRRQGAPPQAAQR